MANEARLFAEGVNNVIVRQFTVADGTAIPKGTLLVASSTTRTGVIHAIATLRAPLGFTTMSKEANDGFTEVGVQRTGVVDAYIDGSVALGDLVSVSQTTANRVKSLNTSVATGLSYMELQMILGRAIEGGTDGQRIRIALNLG